MLTLELPGERFDPLNVEENKDMSLAEMVDRLQAGVGSEIRYSYRGGVNRLTLRLPRKNAGDRLFLRNLLILMLPVMVQYLFQNLANSADGIILGFLDSASMSAVSLVNRFAEIHQFLINAFVTAVTVQVTQLWAVRDREQAGRVAANSALMIIGNLAQSVTNGSNTGGSILIGSLLGKGKLDEAKEKMDLLMRSGVIIGLAEAGAFAAGVVVMRFLPLALDETARLYCDELLIFFAVNQFFHARNGIICNAALYAGGDSKGLIAVDTIVMWGILVPAAIFLPRVAAVPSFVVLILLNNSETLSFPLKYLRMKQGKWLRKVT